MNTYFEYCNELLARWRKSELVLKTNFGFDLNALPEPYLKFGEPTNDLYFLTTNPGGVMDFQMRENEYSPIGEMYSELSERLGLHYKDVLPSRSEARKRISAMYSITNRIFRGSNGFIQAEISPFHSANFPDKEKFALDVLSEEHDIHKEYVDILTTLLEHKNCICIQGGKPKPERINDNWIKLISKIMSVEPKNWNKMNFKYNKNGEATTGAFYYKHKDFFKVILFRDGTNGCPAIQSMNELFEILQ